MFTPNMSAVTIPPEMLVILCLIGISLFVVLILILRFIRFISPKRNKMEYPLTSHNYLPSFDDE